MWSVYHSLCLYLNDLEKQDYVIVHLSFEQLGFTTVQTNSWVEYRVLWYLEHDIQRREITNSIFFYTNSEVFSWNSYMMEPDN